jgi:glycosyltransferase involved in cell wall biosynthesis
MTSSPDVKKRIKYCCLVLTKNEEGSIGGVLAELRSVFESSCPGELELVLSDDSTDRTRNVARALGARVVDGGGLGLGRAYQNGIRECLKGSPDRIFVIDGDGQADLGEIPDFAAAMDRTGAQMITGSRFLKKDSIGYAYGRINRIGIRLLSTYLSLATGQRFTDSHGGLRLLSAELAHAQTIRGKHTYVQESIVDAIGRGFEVVEIASRWTGRRHGESRVVKSVARYVRRTLPHLIYRAFWITSRRLTA